jgi:ATP-binding cassette subfamily F protein uup
MVDHLFVFEGNGAIKDIVGNYTEYRKQTAVDYKRDKQEEKEGASVETVKVTQIADAADKSTEKRKLSFKEKFELEQIEKELEALEEEKQVLTEKLSSAELSNDEVVATGLRLSDVVSSLEQKSDRWLELSEFI